MAFLEVEFPRGISFRSLGGPGFSTIVNPGFSGQEQRNQNWASSKGKWNVSLMTQSSTQFPAGRQAFIDALNAFFLNAAGKANSFRLWDAKDHSLAGQVIGVGDGSTTAFQLTKRYVVGANIYTRNVTKPVWGTALTWQGAPLPNSISLAVAGVPQPQPAWTINAATGIVTFGTAPAIGAIVSVIAGDFHYAVRFDTDELPIQVEGSYVQGGQTMISVNGIQLVEVFPPNY